MYLGALIMIFLYTMKNLKKISDGTLIMGMAVLVYCISAFVGISIPVAEYQLFLFLGLLAGWFKHRDDEKMLAETFNALQEAEKQTENVPSLDDESGRESVDTSLDSEPDDSISDETQAVQEQ